MKKERLDVLLVERGLFESREKAKAAIMAGLIHSESERLDKAGVKIPVDTHLMVKGNTMPYVSRGGLKLEKAIELYTIDLTDAVMVDIGASTGGFTDCMLQNGAVKVYSVDVGHGQLDWKLRQDDRVIVMEKTNARYLEEKDIDEKIEFASADVSFISLTKIIHAVKKLLDEKGEMVCLIKPQFEAGRDKVGKKGVVKDKSVHREVVLNIMDFVLKEGFDILNLDFSPIKGPEGNIEYLIHIKKNNENPLDMVKENVEIVINSAHEGLKQG